MPAPVDITVTTPRGTSATGPRSVHLRDPDSTTATTAPTTGADNDDCADNDCDRADNDDDGSYDDDNLGADFAAVVDGSVVSSQWTGTTR